MLFVLAAAGVVWFLVTDAGVYLTYTPEKYTDYYWPRRAGLILHVGAGSLALCVGLVQVALGLSGRRWHVHRVLGRVYLAAVFLGVAASFYMAATIPAGSPVYSSGLTGLGVAWLVTTAAGYRYILRGDIVSHRAWMIRSYVVTFGFVSLRVMSEIIAAFGIMSEEDANSPTAWLCWVVPLAILEFIYRQTHWSKPGIAASVAPSND